MGARERILDVLPPTYTVDASSVVHQLLDAVALELDAYAEDLDRMRRTHWLDLVYRVGDLERLAALVGVRRLSWETLPHFRERLRALVTARLEGSVGPSAIREFVFTMLSRSEATLGATLVPGLPRSDEPDGERIAYETDPRRPAYAPLQLVENPPRQASSQALAERGGRVPYLFRWRDTNAGLGDALTTVTIVGHPGGRTALPVVANLTTGHAVLYNGALGVGQRLTVTPVAPGTGVAPLDRTARASLDTGAGEHDVTSRVFSLSGFRLGVPFHLDGDGPGGPDREGPFLPLQARGDNEWIYLSGAVFGTPGLDRMFLQIADDQLTETVFDAATFDHGVFPGGPRASVAVSWPEREPAAFAVVVPRGVVAVPARHGATPQEFATALEADLQGLRAAGVRSRLVLRPFTHRQQQRTRVQLPWVALPRQKGSAGRDAAPGTTGFFSQSAFDTGRFG
jgi:hypothetical protein